MATVRTNEDDEGINFSQSNGSSSNEIFNFACHAENALKVMDSYFRDKKLTDVTLVVGNTRIAAHRLILSASSDYFAAMFSSSLRESVLDKIELKEIDEYALIALVRYSYTGCIALGKENVETLLTTAHRLQVNPVVEACNEFLIEQLDPSNCLGIRKFADTHGCDNLSRVANAYTLDNFVEVVDSEEFILLSADEVAEFLKSEDVNVPSEETIFNALTTWLKHDFENRNKHTPTLLGYVRLPLLTPRFITDNVQRNELFRDQKAVQDLILEAFTYHRRQERTGSLLQSGCTRPRKSTWDVLLVLGECCGADGNTPLPIDAFFLRDNVWKNVTNITNGRKFFRAAFFENELFVVGGILGNTATNTVCSFDFFNGLWKDRPPMQSCREAAGVAVLEGFLYVVGGYNGSNQINTVERWNPASGEWSYVSPMLQRRSKASVAVVNNKLYVMGGWSFDYRGELNTVECYDPHKDEWAYCSPMVEARDSVGLGVLNGYIYVTGGFRLNDGNSNSVARYDPKTDTWTIKEPMNVARADHGVGVLGNRLFAVGGWDGFRHMTVVEAYDPTLNQWQQLAPLKVGRAGPCVVVDKSIWKL